MKGCRPLTQDEVERVMASFGGTYGARDRALFSLGVKTGFRVSELLSLTVGDVWQDGRVVDSVKVARRNVKRRIEGRVVPLHAHTREALRVWVESIADDPKVGPASYLFRSRKGLNRPISRQQAHTILHNAFTAVGLTGNLGTHTMRKTFANGVYHRLCQRRADGAPIDPFRLTSKALGHKNINSTDQYLSFLEDDINAAILG